MENSISWSQDQMLEVVLKEPDDFLKVRETLSRIGVASRKERKVVSVLSYITQTRQVLHCTLQRTFCIRW